MLVVANLSYCIYNGFMDPELTRKIDELAVKIDALQAIVASTRKMFVWTLIISIAVIVLPMIGLAFVLPQFLSNYTSALQ